MLFSNNGPFVILIKLNGFTNDVYFFFVILIKLNGYLEQNNDAICNDAVYYKTMLVRHSLLINGFAYNLLLYRN